MGELCDRVGEFIIGFEFMLYSGVLDLVIVWCVVKGCNCENVMFILDIWYWVRVK